MAAKAVLILESFNEMETTALNVMLKVTNLIFECEQRHHINDSIQDVFVFLNDLGYKGYFFKMGRSNGWKNLIMNRVKILMIPNT